MLKMSWDDRQQLRVHVQEIKLTNEVRLLEFRVQDNESDHRSQSWNSTKTESEVDGGLVLFPHSRKEK
jgi:hypothetical protein